MKYSSLISTLIAAALLCGCSHAHDHEHDYGHEAFEHDHDAHGYSEESAGHEDHAVGEIHVSEAQAHWLQLTLVLKSM